MARLAQAPREEVPAGDPYALVVVIEDHPFDADETFEADLVTAAGQAAKTSFAVTARAGGSPDDLTGIDETGNLVLTLSLTAAQTRALEDEKTLVYDVQQVAGPTLFGGILDVKPDATR